MKTNELDPNAQAAGAAVAAGATPAEKPQAQPKPKEKTKEDLAAIEEFTDKLLGRDEESKKKDAEKEKTKKAAAPAPEKTDEEKAAEAAAAAEAKKKKASAKPAAAPPVDVTDISRAVADGIREGLKTEGKKPGAKEQPPADDFELPEAEKRKIVVLERMEKQFPDKHKGLSKKYTEQLKAAEKYADDWEKKNPGRAFDENDPEHTAFFDAQDVDWDDEDYRKTEIAIEAEKIVEERMAPVNSELAEWKREKRLAAETPKIMAQRDSAAKEYWETIGDDFGKLLKADGTVDKDVVAELEKTDPIGLNVTLHYAEKIVEPVAAEIYKLAEGLVDYNPKNRMHADIGAFATQQENAILEMPPEKHVDGRGRRFATSEEWATLTPDQQKKRWILTASHLTKLWTAEKAAEAKQIATAEREKIKKYAGAYAGTPAANPQQRTERAAVKPGEEDGAPTVDEDGKPITPSVTDATKLAGQRKQGNTTGEDKVLNWALS